MALLTLKKKRKGMADVLYLDFNMLDREQVIDVILQLKKQIYDIFKEHIGEKQAISSEDLFERVFGINPLEIEVYKRTYWFNIVKEVIRQLRGADRMFIIRKRQIYFVVKEQSEAEYYKNICDRDIMKLENAKKRVDNWVRLKKWEKI